MKPGTLEIDGVEYPDGHASDPNLINWMRGAPPPPALLIRFADDRFLEFPQLRWSLSHMRELVPTANVWRGVREASDLGGGARDLDAAIDALAFADLQGRMLNWTDSLTDTYTDGIVVLHRGKRIYERYFGALQPHRPHACFSMTKSYAATLAATLIHEGVLDDRKPVPFYLPQMSATAYGDATLRQLLDMQVGVAYSELYSDPGAQIWEYARAGGLRPRPHNYAGADNFYDFLATLRKEDEHGRAFAYKTVNTEVLCWIMKRVTGIGLADMLSERLWSRLGCEQDGYLCVDSIGVEMGGAGLNATLRDLARFGEMMRQEGAWRGEQLVPAAVVAGIRRGSDPRKFAMAGYTLLPGYSYRDMWWVAHDELDAFEARGIHGQRLYVAPRAEMVVARFASHPLAASAANDPITLPALRALAQLLMHAQ
ncbi:MAG TPA: serine hydrolase [Steroidobacteraceae bacterium]|nr:serine hydrolase [Steroidobacteraceae bacterium]